MELLLVAAVVVVIVAGAIYIAVRNQGSRRETGRQEGNADVPVGTEGDEPADSSTERATPHQPPRREFYKSMGVESSEAMKLRLYSPDEYESELAGDGIALGDGGLVAARKAYRWLDEEWHDYDPEKAAKVL